MPAKELNQLRRKALQQLEEKFLARYHRDSNMDRCKTDDKGNTGGQTEVICTAYVETKEQLDAVLEEQLVKRIYISMHLTGALASESRQEDAEWLGKLRAKLHEQGREVFLAFPYIWRKRQEDAFERVQEQMFDAVDGILVRNLEEFSYVQGKNAQITCVTDYTAYAMNTQAVAQWKEAGADGVTLPAELNKRELIALSKKIDVWKELVIYGHMPMMVSAQCLVKNTEGCMQKPRRLSLKDRKGNYHIVRNYCDTCYCMIYNSDPLYLFDQMDEIEQKMHVCSVRLCFTTETYKQVKKILSSYAKRMGCGTNFTRGHWNRGVE